MPREPKAFEEARRWGIDLTLIEENLRLTPQQRIEQHQRALDTMLSLREAGEKARKEKTK